MSTGARLPNASATLWLQCWGALEASAFCSVTGPRILLPLVRCAFGVQGAGKPSVSTAEDGIYLETVFLHI